tara:strand:- start:958 stop:1182 length:225 start_codon:yes stop_codon:yes gene_type:complete
MANLTLSINNDLLHRARVRAAEQGTSVNAVVRNLIEGYASSSRAEIARRRLVALSVSSTSGSGNTSKKIVEHAR